MMSAVVTTPTIVRTIAQLCLVAGAVYVVEPDLSTAWSVRVVAEYTTVVSTACVYSHRGVQLLHYVRLCQQPNTWRCSEESPTKTISCTVACKDHSFRVRRNFEPEFVILPRK